MSDAAVLIGHTTIAPFLFTSLNSHIDSTIPANSRRNNFTDCRFSHQRSGSKSPSRALATVTTIPAGNILVKNITRPSRVIVGRNNHYAFPAPFLQEFCKCFRFFSRTIRIVREFFDLILRHSPLNQIVFHQFADAGIWP